MVQFQNLRRVLILAGCRSGLRTSFALSQRNHLALNRLDSRLFLAAFRCLELLDPLELGDLDLKVLGSRERPLRKSKYNKI